MSSLAFGCASGFGLVPEHAARAPSPQGRSISPVQQHIFPGWGPLEVVEIPGPVGCWAHAWHHGLVGHVVPLGLWAAPWDW